MNGKLAAGIYQEDTPTTELLNPFVHHLELETTYEKVKVSKFTVCLYLGPLQSCISHRCPDNL